MVARNFLHNYHTAVKTFTFTPCHCVELDCLCILSLVAIRFLSFGLVCSALSLSSAVVPATLTSRPQLHRHSTSKAACRSIWLDSFVCRSNHWTHTSCETPYHPTFFLPTAPSTCADLLFPNPRANHLFQDGSRQRRLPLNRNDTHSRLINPLNARPSNPQPRSDHPVPTDQCPDPLLFFHRRLTTIPPRCHIHIRKGVLRRRIRPRKRSAHAGQ